MQVAAGLIKGSANIGVKHGIVIVYGQCNMGRIAKESHGWLVLEPLDIAPEHTNALSARVIASN